MHYGLLKLELVEALEQLCILGFFCLFFKNQQNVKWWNSPLNSLINM